MDHTDLRDLRTMIQPVAGELVVGELLFFASESRRVNDLTKALDLGSMLHVKHLVEQDVSNNMGWNGVGVQKTADENHVLVKVVTSQNGPGLPPGP